MELPRRLRPRFEFKQESDHENDYVRGIVFICSDSNCPERYALALQGIMNDFHAHSVFSELEMRA
jgi:hypothetical protein